MSESFSRREFLKNGNNLLVGAYAATYLLPAQVAIAAATEAIPGYEGGNASLREYHEAQCRVATDPEQCVKTYKPSAGEVVEIVVEAPLKEEGIYRVLPSHLLDLHGRGQETSTPISESFKLSRREWAVGILSSLIFAGEHNRTRRGFDTKTIPSPQFFFGMGTWWLQRKKGATANITAHAVGNGIAVLFYFI